jgi:hypothetical protein
MLEVATPAAIYLASRVTCFVAGYLATRLPPGRPLLHVLGAWDAGYYLAIADGGYPAAFDASRPSVHAFFPLYPLTIRAVHAVTPLSFVQAGVLLNTIFGTGAAVLIWLLVKRLSDRDAATRATALVCFFPWAFVFTMAYAEPLLLLLAAGCLLALHDRRWLIAGLCALLAGAARPNGAALGFCCAWAALDAIRSRREWRSLVAPMLAPLGLLGFFLFLEARTGDFLANVRIKDEAFGDQGIGLAPAGVGTRLAGFADAPLNDLNMVTTVLSIVVVLAGGLALLRWRPPVTLLWWTAPVVALAIVFTTYGSMPRFVLTAFPLVAAIGVWARGTVFTAIFGASATLMGALMIVAGTTIVFTP